MGYGSFSNTAYAAASTLRAATGTSAFTRTDETLRSVPRSQWTVHDNLNVNGVDQRESRDSAEHPTSVAIAVIFDTTGSMHRVPRLLQAELPKLLDSIQQNHYIEHPQILFGAIGDAKFDPIHVQMGQFESDNRMEENLGNIVLYGGGGDGLNESYELALYFMARHTSIDCYEKRGKKGYLFLIADEMPYPEVNPDQLMDIFGESTQVTLTFEDVLAEAKEKYEIYYLLPGGTSNENNSTVHDFWRQHLGADHFLTMPNPEDVVEQIGMTIATNEAINNLGSMVPPTP
jgi:hypothetical protein